MAVLNGQRLNPLAVLWQRAVIANGGTVSRGRLKNVSWLITQLKNYGIWDLTDDFFLICPENGVSAQGLTSLKQLRLGAVSGTVTFVDGNCVFNGGHILTGFIPTSHAVVMTGSNMRLDVWETTNATSGYAAGAQVSSTRNNNIRPRTAGLMSAALNGSSTTGPATTDASGLSSVSRNGSGVGTEYYFWKDGAAATTGGPFTPASTGTTLTNIELTIGAFNNAGTPSTPITGRLRMVAIGATLTSQQQADSYTIWNEFFARIAPGATIYGSNVDFGGIPIGNDTTGVGTAAAPYLTWDVGFTATAALGTLELNGDTSAPATYKSATSSSLSKPINVAGINSRGIKIASETGTNFALRANPATGGTVSLSKAIVDAAENTAGVALRALDLTTQAAAYIFRGTDVLLTGFTGAGQGLTTPSASAQVSAYLTTFDVTATGTRGGIHMHTLVAGGLEYNTGTITLTDQTTSGFGGIVVKAQAEGVFCRTYDVGVSVTLDATLTSTGLHYGVFAENVANVVFDGNGEASQVLTAPGSRQGVCVGITTNLAGDATELPIDGGIIRNWSGCQNTTNGGLGFQIGDDLGDKTKAVGLSIIDCDGSGDASFAAGGGHAVFACNTTDSFLTNVEWTTAGIGIVDKRSIGLINDGAVITDCDSSYILCKGTTNGTHRNGTYTAHLGYSGTMVKVETDTDPGGGDSTGVVIQGNNFVVDGATGTIFVEVDANNSATFANNTYRLTSGTLNANPLRYQGVNYTKAQWLASIEPTATFIGF